jgi:hypothetical protein
MIFLKELITDWGLEAAVTAALAAAFKWLRPRRLFSFISAVKEREDMYAASEYWRQESARWEALTNQCRAERALLDQEISMLRSRLRDGGGE